MRDVFFLFGIYICGSMSMFVLDFSIYSLNFSSMIWFRLNLLAFLSSIPSYKMNVILPLWKLVFYPARCPQVIKSHKLLFEKKIKSYNDNNVHLIYGRLRALKSLIEFQMKITREKQGSWGSLRKMEWSSSFNMVGWEFSGA